MPRRNHLIVWVLALLCFLGSLVQTQLPLATAKEITATNEWTKIGENDTVDAGMHIRIDMQTGEKWVKLASDDGEIDSNRQEAEISQQGGVVVTSGEDGAEQDSDAVDEGGDSDYDFEMMHRTLSNLPEEEKEQMMLPDMPEGPSATPEQRQDFELRMKDIWKKRQEQLRMIEEEYVADLPEILKDRIQRIHDYLKAPVEHLNSMDLAVPAEEGVVSHMVSVLEDLEWQLSDVDMARDFFTMGGWPLLVSLITDDVHQSFNHTNEALPWDKIYEVQARAAWALGTSVKNIGEFGPYATAKVVLVGKEDHVATAVDVVLQQYVSSDDGSASVSVRNNRSHKLLYALGALLRGNRAAQVVFSAAEGPSLLGTELARAVQDDSRSAKKTTQRLLALAHDIVTGVKLHPSKSEQVDAVLVRGFSTEEWCNSLLTALERGDASVQENALLTVQTVSSSCVWNAALAKETLLAVRVSWEESGASRDPSVQRELLKTLDATIETI